MSAVVRVWAVGAGVVAASVLLALAGCASTSNEQAQPQGLMGPTQEDEVAPAPEPCEPTMDTQLPPGKDPTEYFKSYSD
jgi:hypothetical protein